LKLLIRLAAFGGLATVAGFVQWLGQKQKKDPSTIARVQMLAGGAYGAVLVGAVIIGWSRYAWRLPIGLGLMLAAGWALFLVRLVWRRPAAPRPRLGFVPATVEAQVQGPVEIAWLSTSGDASNAGWPQLTRLNPPRKAEETLATPGFLGAGEHLLFRGRLLVRGIPEMADALVAVTEWRVLILDAQQVFAIPRARLQSIAYRTKEPLIAGSKREAVIFTYATESGTRELAGFFSARMFSWTGYDRAALTHELYDGFRSTLTAQAA
jgi:hypothetical protein